MCPVSVARGVDGGQNCHVAAVLRGTGRPVFLKAVEGVSRRMRWLRNESTAGRLAPGVAPAVLFAEDVGDWLVVGFEYVPGRAASLAPGSADLPKVAAAVEKISTLPAPGLRTLRERWIAADCWEKFAQAAPRAVAGWDVDEMSRRSSMVPALVDGDRGSAAGGPPARRERSARGATAPGGVFRCTGRLGQRRADVAKPPADPRRAEPARRSHGRRRSPAGSRASRSRACAASGNQVHRSAADRPGRPVRLVRSGGGGITPVRVGVAAGRRPGRFRRTGDRAPCGEAGLWTDADVHRTQSRMVPDV